MQPQKLEDVLRYLKAYQAEMRGLLTFRISYGYTGTEDKIKSACNSRSNMIHVRNV